ncbi:prolyl oligopeptidase family serine peptidase [Photorhabdus viridis]|uniref:prolyl oligopeptidase family serine peptidase n=1 Tax=Photorhabdus viridis TaxID=3163327 RepID=UPI00330753BA
MERTIISGSSYGGLASSWVAFNHPELFGNVLSKNGFVSIYRPACLKSAGVNWKVFCIITVA